LRCLNSKSRKTIMGTMGTQLVNLPDAVLFNIFNFLPLSSRIAVGQVCENWRRVSRCDHRLWHCFAKAVFKYNAKQSFNDKDDEFPCNLFTLVLRLLLNCESVTYDARDARSSQSSLLMAKFEKVLEEGSWTSSSKSLSISIVKRIFNREEPFRPTSAKPYIFSENIAKSIARTFPQLTSFKLIGGELQSFTQGLSALAHTLAVLHLESCELSNHEEEIALFHNLSENFPLLTDFSYQAVFPKTSPANSNLTWLDPDDYDADIQFPFESLFKLMQQLKKFKLGRVRLDKFIEQLQGKVFPHITEFTHYDSYIPWNNGALLFDAFPAVTKVGLLAPADGSAMVHWVPMFPDSLQVLEIKYGGLDYARPTQDWNYHRHDVTLSAISEHCPQLRKLVFMQGPSMVDNPLAPSISTCFSDVGILGLLNSPFFGLQRLQHLHIEMAKLSFDCLIAVANKLLTSELRYAFIQEIDVPARQQELLEKETARLAAAGFKVNHYWLKVDVSKGGANSGKGLMEHSCVICPKTLTFHAFKNDEELSDA